jgi:hypothetical protein
MHLTLSHFYEATALQNNIIFQHPFTLCGSDFCYTSYLNVQLMVAVSSSLHYKYLNTLCVLAQLAERACGSNSYLKRSTNQTPYVKLVG